eukprot:Awhi_evm1s2526
MYMYVTTISLILAITGGMETSASQMTGVTTSTERCAAAEMQINDTYSCTSTHRIYDNTTDTMVTGTSNWTHTFSGFDGSTFFDDNVNSFGNITSSLICTLGPFDGHHQWAAHCLSIHNPSTQNYQFSTGCDALELKYFVAMVPAIGDEDQHFAVAS